MIQMPSRSILVALMFALGAVACAPPTLDADHAESSQASSKGKKSKSKSKTPADDEADDDDDDELEDDDTTPAKSSGTTTTTGSGAPASFAAVYTSLKASCASCHLTGAAGAPVFFGDTEATTYQDFKDQNFVADPSPLATKGAHSGPALTPDQDAAVSKWLADETK